MVGTWPQRPGPLRRLLNAASPSTAFVPQYARDHANLERLRRLVEEGHVSLRVARALPAEQADDAHRLMEAAGLRGRLVLTF